MRNTFEINGKVFELSYEPDVMCGSVARCCSTIEVDGNNVELYLDYSPDVNTSIEMALVHLHGGMSTAHDLEDFMTREEIEFCRNKLSEFYLSFM